MLMNERDDDLIDFLVKHFLILLLSFYFVRQINIVISDQSSAGRDIYSQTDRFIENRIHSFDVCLLHSGLIYAPSRNTKVMMNQKRFLIK
jgi:hypothetical protein